MYHRRENRESKGEDSLVGFQWGQTYGYTPPSKSDAETGDKMFQGYTAKACENTENGGKIVEGILLWGRHMVVYPQQNSSKANWRRNSNHIVCVTTIIAMHAVITLIIMLELVHFKNNPNNNRTHIRRSHRISAEKMSQDLLNLFIQQ